MAHEKYLDEGWQPTTEYMPCMPSGDPTPQLKRFLDAEKRVRLGDRIELDNTELDGYWADLVRLLQLFRYSTKERNQEEVARLCTTVHVSYAPYAEKMRARVAVHTD